MNTAEGVYINRERRDGRRSAWSNCGAWLVVVVAGRRKYVEDMGRGVGDGRAGSAERATEGSVKEARGAQKSDVWHMVTAADEYTS